MSFIFGSTPDYAKMASDAEQQRQYEIGQGTQGINTAFSQFTPQFYQQRAQAYQNYAMPQVAQQYQQNQQGLTYGLANRGLLGGSAAQTGQYNLDVANAQAQRQVADTGIAQSQALQQQIEGAHNQLLSNLYQSADPSAATQGAIGTAAGFAVPSVFQPIGNAFSNFLNQYATNQLLGASSAYPTISVSPQGSGSSLISQTPVEFYSGGQR